MVNPFEGNKDLKNKDSKQQRDSNNQGFYEVDLVDSLPLYTLHTRVFLTPAKAKTIFLELAQGIDKDLEERDKRNTQTQSVCSFVIVNGGDKRILQKVKEEEGNIKEGEEESIKDKETQSISKKERKQVLEEEESQTEIPPNVIRIETEDNSGEYIEIILPEETQSNNSIPKDDSLFNQAEQFALDVGLSILLRGKYKPKPKTPKKTTQTIKKSKYATKQEVINTLRNKYGLKTSKEWHDMGYKQFDANKTVYLAKDNKQIKQIWEDIIEGAEELKDAINTKTGEKIPMRKLSDGTILKLRRVSDSGGSAIDIGRKNDRKIHNRAKEDGDW